MSEVNYLDLTQLDKFALDRLKDRISEEKRQIALRIAEVARYSNIYNVLDPVINEKQQSDGGNSLAGVRQLLGEIERDVLKASVEFAAYSNFDNLNKDRQDTALQSTALSIAGEIEHELKAIVTSDNSILPPASLKNLEPADALFKFLRIVHPRKLTSKEILAELPEFGFCKTGNYEQNMDSMVRYYTNKQMISRDAGKRYMLTSTGFNSHFGRDESNEMILIKEKTIVMEEPKTTMIEKTVEQQNKEQNSIRDQKGRFVGEDTGRTVDRCVAILRAKNKSELHVKQFVAEFENCYGEKRTPQQIASALRRSANKKQLVTANGRNYFGLLDQPVSRQISM